MFQQIYNKLITEVTDGMQRHLVNLIEKYNQSTEIENSKIWKKNIHIYFLNIEIYGRKDLEEQAHSNSNFM